MRETFVKKALIGQGAYGKVYRVKKELDQNQYALKEVDGTFLRKINKKHEVYIEKYILSHSDHPNIVK